MSEENNTPREIAAHLSKKEAQKLLAFVPHRRQCRANLRYVAFRNFRGESHVFATTGHSAVALRMKDSEGVEFVVSAEILELAIKAASARVGIDVFADGSLKIGALELAAPEVEFVYPDILQIFDRIDSTSSNVFLATDQLKVVAKLDCVLKFSIHDVGCAVHFETQGRDIIGLIMPCRKF